ncbi:uncharacterized protein KRP23_9926 [Phytophthora ramorum]|uniref:uncharacterized protein n=1 Tax=Phytophthora ramorum TaxID=164328 RepID=UPI003094F056|nr:hypothetical protein KRP23_9926 [Phytophthora ramorum]
MLKKKEKLEQMRELGRGGLSKGLHFLRAAAQNSSLENGVEGGSTAEGTGAQGTTNHPKMSYEELLALSMKLTRQNKLMKAQYQKNQSQMATSDADARALRTFLEQELGLDVENSAPGGSIDVEALKEKYRTLSELKHKAETKPVESVNLLGLSPVATEKKPGGYEVIDLLGDAAVGDSQLEQAMQQVERMREQLRQGAEQTKELERKLSEQQDAARRTLEQQEQVEELQRLAELKGELEKKVRELSELLDTGAKEQQEAKQTLAKVEQEKTELIERLQQAQAMSVTELEDEKQKVAAALESQHTELEVAKADNARLREQLETLQVAPEASEDEVQEKAAAALKSQQAELDLAKAENVRLQEQVQALQAAPSPSYNFEEEAKKQVAAALEAQQSEINASKEENARLQEQVQEENVRLREQVEALEAAATSSPDASETQAEDTSETVSSLRAEVNRLQSLLGTKDSDSESLQRELAAVKEQLHNAQEEAATNDRNSEADATLMQELERVKLESAEHAHEVQSLQKKLRAAEERHTKTNSDSEVTQSLVEALKEDTSRLADQVAQYEQKQAASEKEMTELSDAKRDLEYQQEKAHEAKSAMEKQLEEERAYWTSKLEKLITDSDAANTKAKTLEAELREKEKQVTKMAASQTSMTSELMELQKQVSSMREDLAMAAEGLEAHATKAETNERRYIQSEKEVVELKKQLDEMREKHHENFEMLRQEKEAELERVHTERKTLIAEKKQLSQETDEVQARCKSLQRELEAARKHEEELETSLSEQTFQVGNLSVDLAETKKSLSDRMALATRLQTENMGMAGKLAEQVALIESALRDAANSKTAQQVMETQVQAAKVDVHRMKQSETQAKQELGNVQQDMCKQEECFQQEREQAKEALRTAVENEKFNFKRELDRLEAESKHKSKLALQAVLEKEKEIARLSARLHELEEDVRSGGADNRKILEFAQLQAKREAEAREQAAHIQALSQQLEEAHHELRELHEDKRRHAEELTAMLQNQRRDGVNMEYLKNVVVQYMSFRPGSSQQARLVPVLTTLLQFTAADITEVKHAARRGNSWTSWGSSDPALDYKPIVVGAGHRHPMAPPPGQDNGGRRSPLGRMASAPAPRVSPPSGSPPESSRASSFFLPANNDGPADPSAESADF